MLYYWRMQQLLLSMLLATVSCSRQSAGNPSNVNVVTGSSFAVPMQYVMTGISAKTSSTSPRQGDAPISTAGTVPTARISRPQQIYSQSPSSYQTITRNHFPPGPFYANSRPFKQVQQHPPSPSLYQPQHYPSHQSAHPYSPFSTSSHPHNHQAHPNHQPYPNHLQHYSYPSHSNYPPHKSNPPYPTHPLHHSHSTKTNPQSPVLQHYSTTHQHHYYPHQDYSPHSYPLSHTSPNSHHGSHHHHTPNELLELMSPLKKEDTFFPTPTKSIPGSLYGFLMPLMLLGISIPAIGFMYTYLSRRSFSPTFQDYIRPPSPEDLDYYTKLVHRSIQCIQSPADCFNKRKHLLTNKKI